MHSLSFVGGGTIRSHFRIHLAKITKNFVKYIYPINPSIKRETLLLTYKLEMEKNNIIGRKSKNKMREGGVKVLSYFK